MMLERRKFSWMLAAGAALLCGRARVLFASPQMAPNPQRPAPPDRVLVPEGRPDHSAEALKASLEQRQAQLKKDVQRLYEIATEMKNEADKIDVSKVLPVALVKKSEEIEKLAKHIKSLAQG